MMLTFAQYISETFERYKGWMSPSGDAHPVSGEHCFDHHPEIAGHIARQVKKQHPRKKHIGWDELHGTVRTAKGKGYTRFGSQTGYGHYIDYDKDAPGGKESALYALNHLKPNLNEPIHIENTHWGGAHTSFDSPGKAAHHIRTS